MRTAAIVLVAAVLLAAGGMRIRTFLQTRSAGSGYLAIAATGVGLAMLLNAPGPYVWCDQFIFSRPNTSILVSYILTAIAAAAACEMVAALVAEHGARGRRLRFLAQALIVVAMITTFTVAAPDHEDALFFERYKDDPSLAVFWWVFIASVTVQLVYVASLTLRYTRHDDKWLGRGLRLIGYGSACVALSLASRLAEVALGTVPRGTDTATVTLLIAGGFLLAVGVLLPQAGLFADRRLSRRRLYPLWMAVTSECPYVRANARRPSLYRSVIEVHDALAEARSQRKINTPILQALDGLAPRPSDEFDATVRDLLTVSDMLRSLTVPTIRATAPR